MDQLPGSAGELIHATDTRYVFAVDLCSSTGGAVLPHKHRRNPDAHALQCAHLRSGVGYTGGVFLAAAQRVFFAGRNAAAVVGRSIGQHNEQMPRGWAGCEL